MTMCGAVGALTVGGREVASFRCDREEGHASGAFPRVLDRGSFDPPRPSIVQLEATRHRYVLEWADDDETMMLPEAELFDPDERFDVDLPFP